MSRQGEFEMNTACAATSNVVPDGIHLARCPHFWPVQLGSHAIAGYCASPHFTM